MVVVVGAMALLLLAAKHAAGGAVGRLPIVSAASLNVPVPGAHSCFFLVLGCVCVFGCGERRQTHHTQHTQKKHSPQAAPPAASAKLVPHLAQVVALAHVEQPGILQLVAGFLLVGSVCVCSSFLLSVCMFFFVRVTHLANQTPAPLSSRSRPTLPCARVETINNAAISIAVAARQAWGARGGAALGGAIAARFGMRMCVPLSLNASRAVLPGAHGGSIECISSSLYARLLLRSVYVCWGEWSDTPRKSLRREK